jgi:hypothetical protein
VGGKDSLHACLQCRVAGRKRVFQRCGSTFSWFKKPCIKQGNQSYALPATSTTPAVAWKWSRACCGPPAYQHRARANCQASAKHSSCMKRFTGGAVAPLLASGVCGSGQSRFVLAQSCQQKSSFTLCEHAAFVHDNPGCWTDDTAQASCDEEPMLGVLGCTWG